MQDTKGRQAQSELRDSHEKTLDQASSVGCAEGTAGEECNRHQRPSSLLESFSVGRLGSLHRRRPGDRHLIMLALTFMSLAVLSGAMIYYIAGHEKRSMSYRFPLKASETRSSLTIER